MARPCSQKRVATKTPPALRRFDSQSPRIRHVAVRCSVRCWRILWLEVSCWLDGWSMVFIEQVSCAYHEIAMPWAAMSFGLFASACATCSASHCPSQGGSLSQCSDETCRCGSSNSCVGKDLKLHSKGEKKHASLSNKWLYHVVPNLKNEEPSNGRREIHWSNSIKPCKSPLKLLVMVMGQGPRPGMVPTHSWFVASDSPRLDPSPTHSCPTQLPWRPGPVGPFSSWKTWANLAELQVFTPSSSMCHGSTPKHPKTGKSFLTAPWIDTKAFFTIKGLQF